MSVPSHARVLIVEDEALIAVAIEDILSERGYDIVGVAYTVPEALKLLNLRPHLTLLDVKLGSETSVPIAHRCRELGISVVLTTGYASSTLPDGFGELPVLSKPYAVDDLCEMVNRAAQTARVQPRGARHPERLDPAIRPL
ncbi:MAG: response regulator receiver modulated sensor protein [Hyphomicrobiales bacterium]|nr:response regulator receiver modulated sensor protein [Hyphomicrobiales bacterium]